MKKILVFALLLGSMAMAQTRERVGVLNNIRFADQFGSISAALADIGTNNSGTVIVPAGFTDTVTSTLSIGWNHAPAIGVKVVMMPGSKIRVNITNGTPGVVIYDGSSLECFGATFSGDINGATSTCEVTNFSNTTNVSALVANQHIVTGTFQDTVGIQGISISLNSGTATQVLDLAAVGAPSEIRNNAIFVQQGSTVTAGAVHLHNGFGGGVKLQNNQIRVNNTAGVIPLYISGGETSGYQGQTSEFVIDGGEISCATAQPTIKIDGNPNLNGARGVSQVWIKHLHSQNCGGGTDPTNYITINNASWIHFSDSQFSSGATNFFSITESTGTLTNAIAFDRIGLGCATSNCAGQNFIVDTTTGGYTHSIPSNVKLMPNYGFIAFVNHDEAGELTNYGYSTLNTQRLNSIRFADQFGSLAACYADLPVTGGKCIIPAGYSETMAADLTMSKPNSGFECVANANIQMGTRQIIVPAGTNGVFFDGMVSQGGGDGQTQGCRFTYSGTSAAFLIGASPGSTTRVFRLNNIAVNITGGAGAIGIFLKNTVYFQMNNVSVYGVGNAGTFGIVLDGTGNFSGTGTIINPIIAQLGTGIRGQNTFANSMNAVTIIGGTIQTFVAGGIGIDIDQGDANYIFGTDLESNVTGIRLGAGAVNNFADVRSESNTTDVLAIAGSSFNTMQFRTQTGLPVVVSDAGTNNHFSVAVDGDFNALTYTGLRTRGNCASTASPAVCATSAAGSVTVAAAATTKVVNTTQVTANSQIILTRDNGLGARLGVTCNTQSSLVLGTPYVSARTAGTSFTVTLDVAPTTNPLCFHYQIIN